MNHRSFICGWLLAGLIGMPSLRAADADDRPLPDAVRMRFARADRNGDKKISLEEFQATVAKEQAAVAKRDFGLFDQDADGQLTLEEFWSIPTVESADQRGPLPDPVMGLVNQFIGVMDQHFKNWDQDPDRTIQVNVFMGEIGATIGEPTTSALFRTADQNGDSQVNRAEAKRFVEIQFGVRRSDKKLIRQPSGRVALLGQFQHADQNKDDRLDHNEFLARADAGAKAEEIWTNGDKNKDGFVSWEEWCAMPGRMFDPIEEFRRMDTNLDGLLDPDELLVGADDSIKISAKTAFPAFDTDRNGKLSLAEYRLTMAANPVLRWHEIITDPDWDGKISRAEFVYDRSFPLLRFVYFKLLDLDGNGTLDQKEFVFNLRVPRAFYSLNADGTGWKKLFGMAEFPVIGSPAVSPDGKQIAFNARKANASIAGQSVLVANLDGTNVRNLGHGLMPTWSPDGSQLTCSRGPPQIGAWIIGADGKNERFLCNGWGSEWSPDGKRILFNDNQVVKTYELATKITTTHFDVIKHGYQQVHPNMTWSPDSQRVCVKVSKPNVDEVVTISMDGEPRPKVHAFGPFIATDFGWHPKGDRIVFCMLCKERKHSQLYEFNPDTDDPPKLIEGQDPTVSIAGLCWTPDGRQIIVGTGNF